MQVGPLEVLVEIEPKEEQWIILFLE
jgi:hypothetical protein